MHIRSLAGSIVGLSIILTTVACAASTVAGSPGGPDSSTSPSAVVATSGGLTSQAGSSGPTTATTDSTTSTGGTTGPIATSDHTGSTPTGPTTSTTTTFVQLPACTASTPTTSSAPKRFDVPVTAPVLTVTAGANAWIRHPGTEPLALALYEDGTVITTKGVGAINESLPTLTIGRIEPCLRDTVLTQIEALMTADMGSPTITDQGNTVISLRWSGRPGTDLSVYAFGEGDEYVMEPAKANRAALSKALGAIRKGVGHTELLAPDRLKLVPATRTDKLPGHDWPGPQYLGDVVSELNGAGKCAVISGETATNVRRELGTDSVLSSWVTGGGEAGIIGTFTVGVLLPGQPGCGD